MTSHDVAYTWVQAAAGRPPDAGWVRPCAVAVQLNGGGLGVGGHTGALPHRSPQGPHQPADSPATKGGALLLAAGQLGAASCSSELADDGLGEVGGAAAAAQVAGEVLQRRQAWGRQGWWGKRWQC